MVLLVFGFGYIYTEVIHDSTWETSRHKVTLLPLYHHYLQATEATKQVAESWLYLQTSQQPRSMQHFTQIPFIKM
jgi:hypothetical protein